MSAGSSTQNSVKTDNLLPNGGFESGPAFLGSPGEGVLLVSDPSLVKSALQQWTTMGNVKYINSKNFFDPEGNAAIEIVSGVLEYKQQNEFQRILIITWNSCWEMPMTRALG
ncbi:Hypothetical predicted protein [Olea europaea subsp. europaea]|uniref:Uncharacterized protein n=1 Tax=Olea europaea subsp. europaea TaxID=158383 RepID=A0A8S0TQ64_OLEEU|nr:Hypothetical predicted protein [Olea europaea subsp. europaea]